MSRTPIHSRSVGRRVGYVVVESGRNGTWFVVRGLVLVAINWSDIQRPYIVLKNPGLED